jgi:hypothetical protein
MSFASISVDRSIAARMATEVELEMLFIDAAIPV